MTRNHDEFADDSGTSSGNGPNNGGGNGGPDNGSGGDRVEENAVPLNDMFSNIPVIGMKIGNDENYLTDNHSASMNEIFADVPIIETGPVHETDVPTPADDHSLQGNLLEIPGHEVQTETIVHDVSQEHHTSQSGEPTHDTWVSGLNDHDDHGLSL